VPWELLISSPLPTSDHFASFSHSLTLLDGQGKKKKKKKKKKKRKKKLFPACTVFPTPLLFRPCPFFYSPPSLILVLPFFPTLPPKTKLPAPSSLGPYIIPFGGHNTSGRKKKFHKSHGYPSTFSLPSTLPIPYLTLSRRPGSAHPLDLFVTSFAEGRKNKLGCIYNSQLQLVGLFLLSSTLINFLPIHFC